MNHSSVVLYLWISHSFTIIITIRIQHLITGHLACLMLGEICYTVRVRPLFHVLATVVSRRELQSSCRFIVLF